MQPKIKYRLEVWGPAVIMQILEMDERFRGNHVFNACNGMNVVSNFAPAITSYDKLFLRGSDKSADLYLMIHESESNNGHKYADRIHAALLDWATNWEVFVGDYQPRDPVDVLREYSAETPANKSVDKHSIICKCISLLCENQSTRKPVRTSEGSVYTIG